MNHTVVCKSVASYSAGVSEAVEAIFDACAATQALGAHSHVLLKPNLLAKHAPDKAVTTHPAVLRAVILALQRRGVQHITVADSSGGLYNEGSMRAIYNTSGLAAVCEDTGAQLFLACTAAPVSGAGQRVSSFNLLTAVTQADFIINLPKFKTHVMMGMTCAVKNLFGTIPGLQKAELHTRFPTPAAFGEMLVDLCETVHPQLHIVDAVIGLEGDGPAGGDPRSVGRIFGGEDPYAIDLFAAHLMGFAPMDIPYLAAAHARGLCAASYTPATLLADPGTETPLPAWKLPRGKRTATFDGKLPRALRPAVQAMQRAAAPHPKINRSKCIGCGKCAEICPAHTISVTNHKAHINPSACIRCFCCHEMCPVKAIAVKRIRIFDL